MSDVWSQIFPLAKRSTYRRQGMALQVDGQHPDAPILAQAAELLVDWLELEQLDIRVELKPIDREQGAAAYFELKPQLEQPLDYFHVVICMGESGNTPDLLWWRIVSIAHEFAHVYDFNELYGGLTPYQAWEQDGLELWESEFEGGAGAIGEDATNAITWPWAIALWQELMGSQPPEDTSEYWPPKKPVTAAFTGTAVYSLEPFEQGADTGRRTFVHYPLFNKLFLAPNDAPHHQILDRIHNDRPERFFTPEEVTMLQATGDAHPQETAQQGTLSEDEAKIHYFGEPLPWHALTSLEQRFGPLHQIPDGSFSDWSAA